jgi:L-lactate dehydrogenase complex protein LldF
MEMRSSEFSENARRALADGDLRQKIWKSTHTGLAMRKITVDELPEWEELRERAHAIRKNCIENLNGYLDNFERHARGNGMTIHHAATGDDANKIIYDIVRRSEAGSVIKSKSMITEETHLNGMLEDNGIRVTETDLGEFIIQLAHEPPSHIITPAIHKSKEDVARLFQEHLNIPYTDDPGQLTAAAREYMRREFLSARVGITGVNFACADTGTLVIVENEGNVRMCSVMPDIHIAVMSVDKVIPSFADVPLFLRLLTRSASGQRITSYISMVNGPRSAQNPDGPRQLHIVVLDGGRRQLAAHPELKEALYCIRCGACMNVCPVYQSVGGHAYGSVYPGPIGSVVTPILFDMNEAKELPYASSLCGACTDICPVKIDLHRHLLMERHAIVRKGYKSFSEKAAMAVWKWIASDPSRIEAAGRFGWLLQKLFGSKLVLPGWTPFRSIPEIRRHSFRTLMRRRLKKNE